jgi:hypothetical protein
MQERKGKWFKRTLWIRFAVVMLFMSPCTGRANDSTFESWNDITTIYKFSERWRYDGDQGFRFAISGQDFTLLYVRPSVRYRVNSWFTVHGGIRFYRTDFRDDLDVFEVGPWQGLQFTWPRFKGYAVSHYLRLEERMLWSENGEGDFNFRLRSRYRLGVRTPIYHLLLPKGIYLTGSVEFFRDLGEGSPQGLFDRIRYSLGVGTNISKQWRVELLAVTQDGGEIDLDPFDADQRIVRLRFFYSFN